MPNGGIAQQGRLLGFMPTPIDIFITVIKYELKDVVDVQESLFDRTTFIVITE